MSVLCMMGHCLRFKSLASMISLTGCWSILKECCFIRTSVTMCHFMPLYQPGFVQWQPSFGSCSPKVASKQTLSLKQSKAIHGTRPFLPDGAVPSGNFRYTRTKDSMGLYVFALDWSHKNRESGHLEIPLKIKGYVSFY